MQPFSKEILDNISEDISTAVLVKSINKAIEDMEKARENVEKYDSVNHPSHYTSHPSGVECIDIAKYHNFCVGNAIKYIWRHGLKTEPGMADNAKSIEDLEKAVWYLNKEIEFLKNKYFNITSEDASKGSKESFKDDIEIHVTTKLDKDYYITAIKEYFNERKEIILEKEGRYVGELIDCTPPIFIDLLQFNFSIDCTEDAILYLECITCDENGELSFTFKAVSRESDKEKVFMLDEHNYELDEIILEKVYDYLLHIVTDITY